MIPLQVVTITSRERAFPDFAEAWPLALIKSGASASKLRRLIVVLLTYNFYPEAIFAVAEARARKIFRDEESEELLQIISAAKKAASRQLKWVIEDLRKTNGLHWAQYIWQPYPSS